MEDKLLSPEEARKILGISKHTLYTWSRQGRFTEIRTNGNHRRYKLSEIDPSLFNNDSEEPITSRKLCYARVSKESKNEELEKQCQFFSEFYPTYTVITDIGSGKDFSNRKGFNRILTAILKGNIEEIVVTNKDRLCKTGYDLFEKLFTKCCKKGKITCGA